MRLRSLAAALVAFLVAVPLACTCGGGGEVCSSSADCPVADVCNTYGRCEASPAPEFVNTGLPSGTVNVAYTASFVVHGGAAPYQFSLGAGESLPAGLSMDQGGALSGTPTAAGTTSFSVTVVDASGKAVSATFSIVINPASGTALSVSTPSLPAATVGVAYTATLAAAGGTAPYTWTTATGALPTGLALASSGQISGTPSVAGTFTFGVQVSDASSPRQLASATFTLLVNNASGATLTITTNSLPAGSVGTAYSQALAASGGTAPYSWSVVVGSLPAGLTLSSSGTISGTPTTAGTFGFTVQVTDSSATVQASQSALSLVVNSAPGGGLSITTATLPAATVGSAYTFQLQAAGGTAPYTWALAAGALPSGLTLSSSGVLSGTPTAAGTSTFTVEVTDSAATPATAARQLSLTVQANPSNSVVILTNQLPPGTVGRAYSATFQAGGGTAPYQFSVAQGALPPGLSLASGGQLTGTPTTAGAFTFTIRATDSAATPGTADKAFTLDVGSAPGAFTITTTALPAGHVGVAYNATLTAANGTAPYTWALAGGALPTGLSLSSSGVISGTPTTSGGSLFTVSVTDSGATAQTATKQLGILVR